MHSNHFAGVNTSAHPHACIIYDNLAAYRLIASGYIFEGLAANEKCIMAVDKYTREMIGTDLTHVTPNFQSVLNSGQLTLIKVENSYSGKERFDPDRTIKIWQEASAKSIDEGYAALRFVGEATFSIGGAQNIEKLIYYENILNQILFPNYPFKSLCVYDKTQYNPEVIRAAISAHPILFYNDDLYLENIHYVPPEIHFNGGHTRDEVDIWLANVRRNNENFISIKSIARDITQRKQMEQKLVESERQLKKAHEEMEMRVEKRTRALLDTVQTLKAQNHEIELLNEMGDLLQICITEDESYNTLSGICKKMWPDSMGFLGIHDKTFSLNTIEASWGEPVVHADPFSPEECWAFRRGKCHSTL